MRPSISLSTAFAAGLALLALLPSGSRTAAAGPADQVPFSTILDRIDRHVVMVSLRFQKDLEAEASGAVGVDPDASTEQFRRWRMSMRVPGFVMRDRKTVLCSDLFLPPGTIKSIEVEARGGGAVPAALSAFLPRCGGILLTVEKDLDTAPVPFPTEVSVAPETPIFAGSLAEGLRGLESWAESLGSARRRAFSGEGFSYGRPERSTAGLGGSGLSRTIDLVVREDGTPLGFRFGGSVDLAQSIWKGPDVLKELEAAIPFASMKDRAQKLNDTSFVHQVRIFYREPPKDGGGDDGPFGMISRMRGGHGEPDDDTRWFGLAISHDTLLVPGTVPDDWVKRIDKVVVEDDGDPEIQATYEGRVKGFGAFVLKLAGGYVDGLPAARPETPATESAFLVHRVSRRGGARRDLVEPNRSLGRSRGYGDRTYFTSEEAVPAGSFVLDLGGRVLGLAVELLPEDADKGAPRGRRGEDDGSRGVVAALFSELGEPESLGKELDRRVLPQKAEDAKRLPWLGVEVEPIRGAEVAEALGISGPTRDGARGLLVNHVYEGSPAARAGILVDDVLLSARRTCGPGCDAPPVNLRDAAGGSDWPDESAAPRPWKPRENAIVKTLDGWGVGTTYDLEVWHAGAVKTVSAAVELSPRDASSAKKVKDAGTGLTVHEATYEVRAALHLGKDAAGVVVAEVEEGTAAAQAHVLAGEVLLEMDGKPLSDPAVFSAGLSAARAAGKESVRMVVLHLDRSRFVDVRLTAVPDADGSKPPGPGSDVPPGK